MRLSAVSRAFDKTPFQDVYGGSIFYGQIDPLDFYKIDGAVVKRRLMSTAPDVVIPARRTVVVEGQVYIVGDSSPDHWNGEVVRNRYVIQGADYQATVRTIAEALADSAGLEAWVTRDWSKDTTDNRVSAENVSQYHMFFSASEDVPDESVLTLTDGRHYLVQGVHRALSGFIDAVANEVPEPVFETISFGDRVYNPITDTFTSTPANVRIMRLRWQEAFRYLSRASVEYERGDLLVMMLKTGTPTPSPNDILTLSDGQWKIVSHIAHTDHYSLHLRRV